MSSKLTSKGRITLPKRIRQHLQITQGDRIHFLIRPDGNVTLLPATSDVKALKGMVTKPNHPVSIEDMR
ncbi:MAG: type II toxin-antitoxin system PrlF family antitoxin [Desulfatitalea sp.]|nr:type II toxin-antitoxin system PrlF family antitoxin [Desulfatitalea sp.]